MIKHISLFLFFALAVLGSCVQADSEFEQLPPGIWRATLSLTDKPIEPITGDLQPVTEEILSGILPFNFEVIYTSPDKFYIDIINGEERIKVEDIYYGRDRATAKDTVLIKFPIFDSYIKGIFVENVLEGYWSVNYRENYKVPFVAHHGQAHRFTDKKMKSEYNLGGKWKSTFEVDNEDEYPAVGDFKQEGGKLTGTFLTETGDYRYLDGTVIDNKFYLSCFDGSHAFLFEGKVLSQDSIIGSFRSGNHYHTMWEGVRDDEFKLKSAQELTYLKDGVGEFGFSLPSVAGGTLSLTDDKFNDKIKLVTLMGTWCPNCRDEMDFIQNFLTEEKPDDIEVISVAFERYRDDEKSMDVLRRYRSKLDNPIDIVYGGYYDKEEAAKVFPMINHILSYPTLFYVNKNNEVVKIHTGFSGPATSEYGDFKEDFYSTIEDMRKS